MANDIMVKTRTDMASPATAGVFHFVIAPCNKRVPRQSMVFQCARAYDPSTGTEGLVEASSLEKRGVKHPRGFSMVNGLKI